MTKAQVFGALYFGVFAPAFLMVIQAWHYERPAPTPSTGGYIMRWAPDPLRIYVRTKDGAHVCWADPRVAMPSDPIGMKHAICEDAI